jgi:hypothetical protein
VNPRAHRLKTELIILSCMLLIKAMDLQTDCVAATVTALKRAVNITPHSEFAYTGLWDAYGGLGQVASENGARGRGDALPDSSSKCKDPNGTDACLNLATAHYKLATSEYWKWKNGDRYKQ